MPDVKFKKLFLILSLVLIQNLNSIYAQAINQKKMELDNPWLCLKAIRAGYPDITEDFFFDDEVQDWCIKIRRTYFYWAHGRMVEKKDINKWQNWTPFISYYYPTLPPNPKYYSKEFIASLKPDTLVKKRKNAPSPNYSFNKIVYQGNSKREIIKQLKEIRLFGKKIWVHKRIVRPLKNAEKKIIQTGKRDKVTRNFIRQIGNCWGFNWRTIIESGKISNHSWGTAVDILPKNIGNKKIYWYWEAVKNANWMLVKPWQRWAPPQTVIRIFESEGFIWGGKWDIWDNMHFEYRPELLYISKFIESGKTVNLPKRIPKRKTEKKIPENTSDKEKKQEFIPKGNLECILNTAKNIHFIKEYTKKIAEARQTKIDFFKKEVAEERKAIEEHIKDDEDFLIP